MLTLARLLEVLHYDPQTGFFTWTTNLNGHARTGRKAGWNQYSYIKIQIDGKSYPAHRLAWLYMTGEWPTHEIDHINGDPSDNRWSNLREATHQQNMCNRTRLNRRNKSGVQGVYLSKKTGKYHPYANCDGKMIYLGSYACLGRAISVRQAAKYAFYGAFAPHS